VHRFFAPSLDPGDETVTLPRDEGEHLTRVLRLGIGDTVSVFDGRGHEYLARVMSARRRDVRVQIVSRVDPTAESAVHLTLVQSTLKGERMDEVIRDAVMLGVAAVQPVIAKRSEVTVAALLRGGRVDRWRRVALASAKQSRRAVLPEVRTPLALETYLLEPRPALTLMMVEPSSGTEVESVRALRREPPPSEAALLVGPEGGWDPGETQAARSHGVRLMSLGPRTLRADAVPVAAISVLHFLWEDLP
jgi:16S rRNA (uracil1498-N3)-methyltransferase